MTNSQLRDQIKARIDRLPGRRLRSINDFIGYIAQEEVDPETLELMRVPNLLARIKKGEKQYREGKGVNWREVRKDV